MKRNRYAGQPFTTPSADIAATLEQVSIPTLLISHYLSLLADEMLAARDDSMRKGNRFVS